MAPDQSSQTTESAPQTNPQAFTAPLTQPPPAQQPYTGQQPNYAQYAASYGQPFQSYNNAPGVQPYQPTPADQQVYRQQGPLPEQKGWGMTKDVGHAIGVVLSIIGLGLSLSLIPHGQGAIASVASGPVLVVSLVWSGAELITRLVRKFKAGIHPGAHVGMCLILWLAGGIAGGIEATYVALSNFNDYDDECYDYQSDRYYDDCPGPFNGKKGVFTGATVITCIVTILYFALFVGACSDTAKRNAHARQPIMIVAGGAPHWGPMAQGWQQMPQQYTAVPGTEQEQKQSYQPPQQPQYQQQYQQPQYQQQQRALSVPSEQGQNIPLQTRSPSPRMSGATPDVPVVEGRGNDLEEGRGVQEFYTPAEVRT